MAGQQVPCQQPQVGHAHRVQLEQQHLQAGRAGGRGWSGESSAGIRRGRVERYPFRFGAVGQLAKEG